jgi:hypothetical protein
MTNPLETDAISLKLTELIPHIQQAPGENEVEGGNLSNWI